jgi:hypothetical protein
MYSCKNFLLYEYLIAVYDVKTRSGDCIELAAKEVEDALGYLVLDSDVLDSCRNFLLGKSYI